jgi:hypothetical protein
MDKFHYKEKTRIVSLHGLAIYIKTYLKAKEELWRLKYFTIAKNIPNLFFKKSSKRNQILQDIITLHLISSFNTSQNIMFQKSSYKNRPIITYGPKSLKLLYSIINLNTISLPW